AIALSVLETNHLGLAQLSPVGIGIGISLLASPLLAAATTWLIAAPVTFLFKDTAPHRVGYGSRGALAITAAANGLGRGVQYGQRTYIGMLVTRTSGGFNPGSMWLITGCIVVVLGLCTFMTAWRVNYTLTRRISLLDPLHSAVASSTSALLLLIGSFMLHIPLSSSLTTVAAITGAGTAQNSGAVRWIQVVRLMAYFIGTVLVCAAAAFIIIGLGAAAVVNIR